MTSDIVSNILILHNTNQHYPILSKNNSIWSNIAQYFSTLPNIV